MNAQRLIVVNILFIIALYISTYYFIAWREALYDEFSRVGWEHYRGESLKTPAKYFSILVMGTSAFTLYIGFQFFKQEKFKRIGILLNILGLFSFFIGFIMFFGGIYLSARQSWKWNTLFFLNILISVFAFLRILAMRKVMPLPSHDILDDPNSITHHDES